jgi:hypothetical protein
MKSTRPRLSGIALLLAAFLAGGQALAQEANKPKVYSGKVHSHTYHVDKIYKSMEGPTGRRRFELPPTPTPELFWLVGYKAIVVDAESLEPVSQEFMCHSNLDIEADQPRVISPHISGRLFTLSQGQQLIQLPDNFGVPMLSTAKLRQGSQVLNLNLPDQEFDLKHEIEVMLVRDKEATEPIRPLYQREVQLMKSLDKPRYFGMKEGEGDPKLHGASCAVGIDPTGDSPLHRDQLGQEFTAHWVVKPGREVSRANVTRWLNLHHDTTIHYISMHLHPFAESLELYDVTAKKTVWKGLARQREDRIGLEHVDYYSSAEGLPLYKGHEYELISVYDNTSGVDQDAMAVLFLYLLDTDFKKPEL